MIGLAVLDAIVMATLLGIAPSTPSASEAVAEQPDADALREQARRRFDEGRFGEAAELLQELYAIDPRPEYLYSRGQALRLAGDCAGAIGALDAFLATGPPAADVEDAEQWIERCREHLGAQEQSEPPPPTLEAPPEDTPPPVAPRRPWHRDPAAGVLLGVGLAGVAAGTGLVGGAFATAEPSRQEGQADHFDRQRRVDRLAIAGWSVLGVGSALVVGAIVRWVVVRRRAR
jgi:tetratricopeptide (TPR) repeat protein